jgi:hypothetical protein
MPQRKESNWKDSPYGLQILRELDYKIPNTMNDVSIKANINHSVTRNFFKKLLRDGAVTQHQHKAKQLAYTLNKQWLVDEVIDYYVTEYKRAIMNQQGKYEAEDKKKINEFLNLKHDQYQVLEMTNRMYLDQTKELKINHTSFNTWIALYPELRTIVLDKQVLFVPKLKLIKELLQHHSLKPTAISTERINLLKKELETKR